MLENLKKQVLEVNRALVKKGLVTLTWGNASGLNEDRTLMVIKPSGVDFNDLTSSDLVVVDREGRVVEGGLHPSSDTPTHLELYNAFDEIFGIVHSHSPYAVMFSQAQMAIPCLGTTHSDHFYGDIPVTRLLNEVEVKNEYEKNTGKVIVEKFLDYNPLAMPSILVAGHGPFSWGRSPEESLFNSIALESVSKMAWGSLALHGKAGKLPDYIKEKHFQRKHGKKAYYGQKEKKDMR